MPSSMNNLFTYRNMTHNTRHGQDPSLPKMKMEVARRSFLYRGPELWLKLDEDIKKNSQSINASKKKYARSTLSKY